MVIVLECLRVDMEVDSGLTFAQKVRGESYETT